MRERKRVEVQKEMCLTTGSKGSTYILCSAALLSLQSKTLTVFTLVIYETHCASGAMQDY